ncbi:MAG: hypothetical protein ABGY41_18850 [Candidatus Poribacteria bacterium]
MRRSARRLRKEQERAVDLRSARYEWVTKWFAALPHDALLVIKENGIVLGKVWKFDVTWRETSDLYLFLRDDEEYGFGNYRIAARYDGAFRGEHLRVEVGEPDQWKRGTTKAETAAFVEKERARRQLNEDYERNPLGTVVKILANRGALPGSRDAEPPAREGSIPGEVLDATLDALRNASDEDFPRCCQYLLDNLPPAMLREVLSAYRLLEAPTPRRRGRLAG